MLYLVTVIILIVLIVNYDIKGRTNTKVYTHLYYAMMWWFICISGLAYNVGSDIPTYMKWYNDASWSNINSIQDLFDYDNHLMPAWNLLMLLCRSISSNFVLPKMIIATFCNYAIFKFIKEHSVYPFITILFYGLGLYFNMNFNALRQMIAVSIFLLSYDNLQNKNYLKYYAGVVVAYLFHSSALVCAIFPLLNLLDLSRKTLLASTIFILLTSVVFLLSNFSDIAYQFMLFSNQYLSGDMSALADMYLGDVSETGLNLFGKLKTILNLFVIIGIVLVSYNPNHNDSLFYKLSLVYCLFYALTFSIGVVFSRLTYYVEFFYFCVLPLGVMNVSHKITRKTKIIALILLVLLALRPINSLLRVNPNYGYPLMVQYYPYHSVLHPQIDPIRNMLFGSYE